MNIRQKSLIVSVGVAISFLLIISGMVLKIMPVQFQKIEDQRVERNMRRISAVFDDRINQINAKMVDWAIWDDTYYFLINKNKKYIESNLTQESFASSNINEVLFIDKNGNLVTSFLLKKPDVETENDFPEDLFKYFRPNSPLLKINPIKGYNGGYIRTEDGLLIFVVRKVFKSDSTGEPSGHIVFARYFDESLLNSILEMTQSKADLHYWNEINLPADFALAKNNYIERREIPKVIQNEDEISGYIVIEDVNNQPQAIVRGTVERDITQQGKSSMFLLISVLIGLSLILILTNYWFLRLILIKIFRLSTDLVSLSDGKKRLEIGKIPDEVDKLRLKINEMLDTLEESQTKLFNKQQFVDKIMDNLNVGIAVNIISTGKTIYINKAFESIYGWSKDVLGSVDDFFDRVYPDKEEREKLKQKIMADIASGDIEKMRWNGIQITKSNGEKRYVDAGNIPLTNQDMMVSTVMDVTQEVEKNIKRESYSKEMKRLNKIMVDRELRMIQLKQENKKLKEINNLKIKT